MSLLFIYFMIIIVNDANAGQPAIFLGGQLLKWYEKLLMDNNADL